MVNVAAAQATVEPVPCGNATVYCPRGSAAPRAVPLGFYGVHTGADAPRQALEDPGNRTFSAVLACEPGFWCAGGRRFQCPEGHFGWESALSDPKCSGQCSAG